MYLLQCTSCSQFGSPPGFFGSYSRNVTFRIGLCIIPIQPNRGISVITGIVKWFNDSKGYGFITPQDGSKDVFVHISAVERAGLTSLNEGQVLEYEVVSNRGKQAAENLKTR